MDLKVLTTSVVKDRLFECVNADMKVSNRRVVVVNEHEDLVNETEMEDNLPAQRVSFGKKVLQPC